MAAVGSPLDRKSGGVSRVAAMLLALTLLLFGSFCPQAHAGPPGPPKGPAPPSRSLSGIKVCFEKLHDQSTIFMQEHPGRGRAVVGNQRGMITLMTLPSTSKPAPMTKVATWLDLTGRVLYDGNERGLLSFAFHPNFAKNGRFFVAYNCNSTVHPDCKAPCACSPSVGCSLGQTYQGLMGPPSCDSTLIVAEYKAAGPSPLAASSVRAKEVRKVFKHGRPFRWHNGGHIFFGKDGFMYITSGDGGFEGDPFNFAQQTKSLLGKILRVDVDKVPQGASYGIPPSNPFASSRTVLSEVFALGLRQPWRCDVDPVTGTILCGDVGGDQAEEIDLIQAGGNYQWHNTEGTVSYPYAPMNKYTPAGKQVGVQTPPIFEYSHDCSKFKGIRDCAADIPGGLAVIGGVFYRSALNSCLQGLYFFSDYSGPMWVADVSTRKQHNVAYSCSPKSPLPCKSFGDKKSFAAIFSWARDLSGNAYVLAATGIHRVASADKCGYKC